MGKDAIDKIIDAANDSSGESRGDQVLQIKEIGDFGKDNSFTNEVLAIVVSRSYGRALKQLKAYVEVKSSYPNFRFRTQRYIDHAESLINAIRAKRGIPGFETLSKSRQREIQEKTTQHFEELRRTLKKIERIEQSLRMNDVRSTVWVIRSMVHCGFIVLTVAFVLEISNGLLQSVGIVVGDWLNKVSDIVFNSIGF